MLSKLDANEDSFNFLMQANEKSEWLWKFYFKFMIITCSNTAFLSALSAFTCYFKYGKFDEKFLYHPYKVVLVIILLIIYYSFLKTSFCSLKDFSHEYLSSSSSISNDSLPWDAETGFGYFNEILFHTIAGQGYIFFNGTLVLLFIAICLHHEAFFKMHQHLLHNLDKVDKSRNNKKFLCKLINFQVSIRRYAGLNFNQFNSLSFQIIFHSSNSWMMDSVDAYSPFVLLQLVCLTICIACVIFGLDLVKFIIDLY